ncbi:hypothetical protein [Streptomyces sp. NPDC059215]|uniref:hypothetical protein n=1 Tax=Streptomyces sp. NPDC059215 TaxID=3346772 RepID=UPI003689CF80
MSPPAAHTAPVLPPHGEGLPGDQGIQRALEAAWPADLPAGDERELRAAGARVLRADTTGVGRERWPRLFDGRARVIAPAFGLARFRVQAVIARRGSAPERAVIHLVWAATDRGGTFTDGRITDLYFTHTPSRGGSTWTPQPRT